MKRPIVLGLGLILLGSVSASAHHSLSIYDRGHYTTIEGTVKEFVWSNPHTRLIVLVPGEDGRVTEWDLEGGSVNRMSNNGFSRNVIAAGDKIKVAYNPKRDGSTAGFYLAVTMPDGRLLGANRLRGVTPS